MVILMFPLLVESLLLQRSNEISMTVALGHCYLAEIPDSIIPLRSSSGGIMVKTVYSGKNENILNTRVIGKT